MSLQLLLIRHAESVGNASGNYSTAIADSLSEEGLKQAQALVSGLEGWMFDKVVVSPLLRTMQTIAPYLHATQQQAEIWPEISEACWHDDREAIDERWRSQPASVPEQHTAVFVYRDGAAIRPAFPESFGEGLYRVRLAAERFRSMAGPRPQTVLVVTHGHFIRELLNMMLGCSALTEFPHDNCGTTLISLKDAWTLDYCNRHA